MYKVDLVYCTEWMLGTAQGGECLGESSRELCWERDVTFSQKTMYQKIKLMEMGQQQQ